MKVTWTARRSNQSNLKEINSEYSVEGVMLKLKRQNFGTKSRLIGKDGSDAKRRLIGKDPDAGKPEGRRKRG